MNRPPKKHKQHKDDLLRDPRFDQKELENARGAKSDTAGDDRNLVSIDDAMVGADLSDKLWLVWERNKNAIILAVLVIVAVVAGYFGVSYMRAHAHNAMQEAYIQAEATNSLEAFAGKYPDAPLGGAAFLQLADKAYQADNFTDAAALYVSAQEGLAQTVLLGRALLGEGVSLARDGKSEEARKRLGSLVENTAVMGALRGQAAFDLIVLEIGAGNDDAARAWFKRLGEIPGTGIWQEQAAGYAVQRGFAF